MRRTFNMFHLVRYSFIIEWVGRVCKLLIIMDFLNYIYCECDSIEDTMSNLNQTIVFTITKRLNEM